MKTVSRMRGEVATDRCKASPAPTPAGTAVIIRGSTSLRPTLGIVLGSGFHNVPQELETETELPYADLPGFPVPTVKGHPGRLLAGHLGKTPVFILSGRAHFYEGHDMSAVTFAVRTLAACGVTDLLLTNAAGGIARNLRCGDFMRLQDHINLMGSNPLRGPGEPGLERFVDLTRAYDPGLSQILKKAASEVHLRLKQGVYLAVSGPSYETPAEITAFARLGADAVGMSTVPEVIAGRQCGLKVCAISCITNMAAGVTGQPLSHKEVLETAHRVNQQAARLIKTFAKLYGEKR